MGMTSIAIPTARQATIISAFRGLALPTSYFAGGGFTGAQNTERVSGFDANGNPTTLSRLNFVLANLPGGERKYTTVDFTVTRKEMDNWGGFMSVSLVSAKGNSNSSGNADYQGDLAQFDPRLTFTNGRLEGSVDWLAKAYGYYRWDMGFLMGVTLNANSGYHYTPNSWLSSSRVLQNFPGETGFFAENLGTAMTPMVYQADLRFQYGRNFGKVRGEVYMDVINASNRQEATDLSEGLNIRGAAPLPNTPYQYQAPRRYSFGIRIKY